jgi:hypothetical protein
VDTDILKPNTGYLSIERPSAISSSKGTSGHQSSDLETPDPDVIPSSYTEPVSDGEEDEDMDIVPAKDEGRRTGLTETEVAEAIAYREKMLKQAAEDQILNGKHGSSKAKWGDGDEEVLEGHTTDVNERTPFLRARRTTVNAPEHLRALSIDPLAPSSAFDETLKERLRSAKSREGESSIEDTAVDEDEDEDDREEGSSRGAAGDDRVLVRHFKAPHGKRVAIPVRIEPKVYFAAERTFLVGFVPHNASLCLWLTLSY